MKILMNAILEKKSEVLIVFDDMIVDMCSNKKVNK